MASSKLVAVESHEQADVNENGTHLQAVSAEVLAAMSFEVRCQSVPDEAPVPESDTLGTRHKLVHFMRHGEGYHNVAQREWRANPAWDGSSEPYTLDNDPPPHRYLDPELTPKGIEQAKSLQSRVATIMKANPVELIVVSPLRRATQTALLAFETHVGEGLEVLASELCHEMAGRHTCDRRLNKSVLMAQFPVVDYSLIEEEDPLWSDWAREPWLEIGRRAAQFVEWLRSRPESRIAVAAHSCILLAILNAVVSRCEDADSASQQWFGTGEMRTVLLTFIDKPCK